MHFLLPPNFPFHTLHHHLYNQPVSPPNSHTHTHKGALLCSPRLPHQFGFCLSQVLLSGCVTADNGDKGIEVVADVYNLQDSEALLNVTVVNAVISAIIGSKAWGSACCS